MEQEKATILILESFSSSFLDYIFSCPGWNSFLWDCQRTLSRNGSSSRKTCTISDVSDTCQSLPLSQPSFKFAITNLSGLTEFRKCDHTVTKTPQPSECESHIFVKSSKLGLILHPARVQHSRLPQCISMLIWSMHHSERCVTPTIPDF